MAFPSKATIETALTNIAAVATEDELRPKARQLFRKVQEVATLIEAIESTTYANLYSDANFDQDFNS